jgi:hypothetical protein
MSKNPLRARSAFLFSSALALLLTACGGGQPPSDELTTDDEDSAQLAVRQQKTKSIFYSIPSPMETATMLKEAGAEYDKDILNDVLNVDKYTAASKQALNLGIYGADLSYASVFNNTQESMFYTSCAKKLADRLGVSNAFSDSTIDRMEANRNERDSLLNIISETYWTVDAYLKENGRDNISAMMIAGGWVEGLYIATQVTKANDTPAMRQRIAEQKLSLQDLIELMSTYDAADAALAGILGDLKGLNALYTEVNTGGAPTGEVKQEGGVAVIGGGGPPAALTDAQLTAIRDKAAAVRANYIN